MIRPSETLVGTHLNSIWLEGTLLAEPEDLGEEVCQFEVLSRYHPGSEQPSVFRVEATESALEGCRTRLGRGRPVRIIGRLKQGRSGVKIVSEMVEPLAPP